MEVGASGVANETDKKIGRSAIEIPTWLSGQLLIAMPGMQDPRFGRTVLYMCSHTTEGAMGLIINRTMGEVRFEDLMNELGIKGPAARHRISSRLAVPSCSQSGARSPEARVTARCVSSCAMVSRQGKPWRLARGLRNVTLPHFATATVPVVWALA